MSLDIVAAHKALKGTNPTEPTPIPEGPAKPDDLRFDLAQSAYSGSSFVPEKRAKSDQIGYATEVNSFYQELLKMCTNERQRLVVEHEIQIFKQNYLKYYGAVLSAKSRCMSTMITGPSNFPVRQQEKRHNTERKRVEEFLEWAKKAKHAIIKKVRDNRTIDEVQNEEWDALRKDMDGSLAAIDQIDLGRSPYMRALFVNSIVGKVERLAHNGNFDLVSKAILHVIEYNENHKKPAIAVRNKFWKFGRLAEAVEKKQAEQMNKEDETLYDFNGTRVVRNYADDRIQIFFPGKPDEAMRNQLKSAGWRWSPNAGAWQRQRTENAVYSALQILPKPEQV